MKRPRQRPGVTGVHRVIQCGAVGFTGPALVQVQSVVARFHAGEVRRNLYGPVGLGEFGGAVLVVLHHGGGGHSEDPDFQFLFEQADQGDGYRLWNLAPLIPEEERFSRIYRGVGN